MSLQRLLRWLRPRVELPSQVFVICERETPVGVCLDSATVHRETHDRTKGVTRIHQVPLIRPEGEP